MTANTYGLKAAIKAIADGMERYAGKPAYIQSIRNQIGDDGYVPEQLYAEHRQLIDDAKQVVGVIDSYGRHAAGIVISTDTIDDAIGTQTISGWEDRVTQCSMKEIDHVNFVKYDVLGLDNIGLISKTAELAGIDFPTPDSEFIDFNDDKVWKSMRDDNIGIFQFEGDRAGKILRNLFSDRTMQNIREQVPDVNYMDLLSLANGAMRPSGSGFIDAVTHGKFKDNGHPALNKFLSSTLGYIVYQEQLMEFLVKFCNFSESESDLVRRGIGKKDKVIMDEEVPKIKPNFIKTMVNKYHDSQEHAEKIADDFIQVFMDAANYGFSINHSMAYSYIGYISTWLRYYYPLEWCTAAFEIWKGKQEKINKVTKFAERHGINMKPVEFRKSKGLYYMDKDTNTIYEGTATIKGCNRQIGDELYVLRDKKYNFFTDLLIDIFDPTIIEYQNEKLPVLSAYKDREVDFLKQIDLSINKRAGNCNITAEKPFAINSRSMINLIRLRYFKEFGGTQKLVKVYEFFRKNYKPKNKRFVGKYEKYLRCVEYEKSLDCDDFPISVSLQDEMSLLGRCISVNETAPKNIAFVTSVLKRSNKTRVGLYSLRNGYEVAAYIRNADLVNSKLTAGHMLRIKETRMKPKIVKVDGRWQASQSNQELWVDDFSIVQ